MAQLLLRSVRPFAARGHCATIRDRGPVEIPRRGPGRPSLGVAFALLTLLSVAPGARPGQDAPDRAGLREERLAIRADESVALEGIALRLEREGKADDAAAVRSLIVPEPPADGPRRFDPLPEIVPAADPDASAGPMPPEASAARDDAARRYDDLANRAFEAGRLALADSCLREVLRRRPDDAEARRLLGYVPHEGGWATPHAVGRLKKGDVLHETYGWIPADWVPQLGQGLLPSPPRPGRAGTTWIPAAEADASRQGDIASGWQITTPHFKISASVPLAEGIDFARRLEAFYDLFTSVVADVIGPQRLPLAQLHRAPGSTAPALAARQHRVFYFGTKQQYVDYLTPRLRDPNIKDTLGVYLDDQKISFFFKDEGGELPVEATLYHEVSHQLLFELAGPSGYQRNAGNYWVFEGLGTYFETVEQQADGSLRYGGRVGARIEAARQRIVEQDELIPTGRFVALDRGEFNGNLGQRVNASGIGDPFLHYAEAIALAVFLMDHDHQAHRDAFLDYAADAYHGRLRGGSSRSLSSHLGMGYDELDQALTGFLAGSDGPEVAGR